MYLLNTIVASVIFRNRGKANRFDFQFSRLSDNVAIKCQQFAEWSLFSPKAIPIQWPASPSVYKPSCLPNFMVTPVWLANTWNSTNQRINSKAQAKLGFSPVSIWFKLIFLPPSTPVSFHYLRSESSLSTLVRLEYYIQNSCSSSGIMMASNLQLVLLLANLVSLTFIVVVNFT